MAWPPVKPLDHANRVAELEQSKNPFAPVVLAHLKALETRRGRRHWPESHESLDARPSMMMVGQREERR
jgi:hypothetical protein